VEDPADVAQALDFPEPDSALQADLAARGVVQSRPALLEVEIGSSAEIHQAEGMAFHSEGWEAVGRSAGMVGRACLFHREESSGHLHQGFACQTVEVASLLQSQLVVFVVLDLALTWKSWRRRREASSRLLKHRNGLPFGGV
jgi:hypothetical protein